MHVDRKIRVADLIKELTATFVQQEANADPLITITNVVMPSDLGKALIFFTTIPDDREADALIFLKRNASNLRNYLKKKMRIKAIPHIDFMIDAGEKHRQNMDKLVEEIKEQNAESEMKRKLG